MRDFTLIQYERLLRAFQGNGYRIYTVRDYLNSREAIAGKFLILRHDIDLRPENARKVARIEQRLGINSTFYFRAIPQTFVPEIIQDVGAMGHEVGYHYEDLSETHGDVDSAYERFQRNLARFRKLADITTICMHGSPMSPHDSKDIWKKFEFTDLGIIGEPYLSLDFTDIRYLTDTGRRWNGHRASVRDTAGDATILDYAGTPELITALNHNLLPDHLHMTTHPQRWDDDLLPWVKELVLQNAKNVVKEALKKARNR